MASFRHLPTRVLSGVLHRLRWIGLRVEPFLVVREGEFVQDVAPLSDKFTFGFLDASDVPQIAELEQTIPADVVRDWLNNGRLCFGVRDDGRLVANMWCDLDAFSYPPNYRALDGDEAYLYAAYSDPAYRGQRLAPVMRAQCYAALRERGRHRFYSYTEYFNTPARRFKAKLGARNVALRLHVALLDKWSKTLTLREYSKS